MLLGEGPDHSAPVVENGTLFLRPQDYDYELIYE